MEVHLKPEQEEFLQGRVSAGIYANTDEAVQAAINLLEQQEIWTPKPGATGADLVAAMQASPFKEIDIFPPRVPLDLDSSHRDL